ncbi:hypothetical protein CSB45_00305 [candidate division KSB3 bacterium]|uniref:Uncharacterized protein n=1 Tax=candidate division KSB3 bacterium TaxID=2044937 RepID=A0A2G6EF33_9BACT|nr:MAG: hypothetical protein CSB45_00305 [candidate division KSB3 bacterium]PIE28385.1 MAG: hypothetical protein CSA57_14155 [candidate division KSB3 bacterium]
MCVVERDKTYVLWRCTIVLAMFCCVFIIGSNSLGKSRTESGICSYEGSYKFIHSKRIAAGSRCKFSNGANVSRDSGYAILEAKEEGFSFSGGQGARWHVQASCRNPESLTVTIRLENRGCRKEVVSTAVSSFTAGDDGEIRINPYEITWTCGERSWSCDMIETWVLVPELW